MNLQDIRVLIAQGDTAGAIRALANRVNEGVVQKRRLRDDVLILSNRFEELKRKETLGLLEQEDAVRESAQVNEALLNLLAEIESSPISSQHVPRSSRSLVWRSTYTYIAAGLVLMGLLTVYFLWINPEKDSLAKIDKPHPLPVQIDTVFVAGGIFEMGSKTGDEDEFLHSAVVNDFYITSTEITNRDYARFLNEVPKPDSSWINLNVKYKQERCRIIYSSGKYQVEEGYENYPVINVTYAGAQAFAQHYCMRLPTEAEWEYAARGGRYGKQSSFQFAGSDTVDLVAWHWGNSPGRLHAVKTKKPNQLGLYDLSGNVYEWCEDYYADNFYTTPNRENPLNKQPSQWRCVRGGNVFFGAEFCRATNRGKWGPDVPSPGVGFRCVIEVNKRE